MFKLSTSLLPRLERSLDSWCAHCDTYCKHPLATWTRDFQAGLKPAQRPPLYAYSKVSVMFACKLQLGGSLL